MKVRLSPGAVVTQATDKSTAVVIHSRCGQITMNGAALAAAAEVSFTVTNDTVGAADIPVVAIASGATANSYTVDVTAVAAGSFRIQVGNVSAGSLSEALVLNFGVIKGAVG